MVFISLSDKMLFRAAAPSSAPAPSRCWRRWPPCSTTSPRWRCWWRATRTTCPSAATASGQLGPERHAPPPSRGCCRTTTTSIPPASRPVVAASMCPCQQRDARGPQHQPPHPHRILPKLDQFFGMIEDGLKAAEEMQEGWGSGSGQDGGVGRPGTVAGVGFSDHVCVRLQHCFSEQTILRR